MLKGITKMYKYKYDHSKTWRERESKAKKQKVRTATNDFIFTDSSADYFQLIILSIKYQINVNEAHHSFPEPKLLQTVQKLFNYGDK